MHPPELRGRSSALAEAGSTLARVRRSRRGAVVLVTGDAGIGKTALLAALRDNAVGFRVGEAKAEVSAGWEAGRTLIDILRSGDDPLFDEHELRNLQSVLDRPLQLLERSASALREMIGDSPVLIVVDDVQWADRVSRFVLRSLPARLVGSPVAWLICSRDPAVDVIRDLRSDAGPGVGVTHVELTSLSCSDIEAMAKDRLGHVPGAPIRAMLERLGGNPFLVGQLLDSAGAAVDDHGPPPVEFAEGIRRTLSTLDPGAAGVVQLAAVLGRPLAFDEPRAILGAGSRSTSAAAADGALRSGLMTTTGHTMHFHHDLIREAVYSALSPPRREQLHRTCAAYLLDGQDDVIAAAQHLRTVAGVGDTQAVDVLLRAAEQAVAAQPELAGELARDAFALLDPADHDRASAAARCIDVLSSVQRFVDVVAIADEVGRKPAAAEAGARIEAAAAAALFVMGRAPAAAARIDAVLARGPLPQGIRARLQASRALAASRIGTSSEARAGADAALAAARDAGDRQALNTALAATCEVNKNAGYHARTLRAARELRLTAGASYLSQEIMALQLIDQYGEAQAILDAAHADAANNVEAVLPSLMLAGMWQDFWLCRWAGAERAAADLANIGRELGHHVHALEAMSILSVAALQRGDITQARERYQRILRYGNIDDEYRGPRMILINSWILASEGDVNRSARLLRPLLRTALDSRAHWPWWPGWMRTVLQVGRLAGDRELVDSSVAVAAEGAQRNPGVVSFEGLALQLQGLVDDDLDTLEASVDLLRTGPRALLYATAEKDLGHALLQRGAIADGLYRLSTASAAYEQLVIPTAMAAIARTVARYGGASAARPAAVSTRWSSLTASERRVALLVGRGYTGRAAASELNLSPNTVSSHTRAVFAKLEVRSRVQLANLLRNLDQDDQQDSGVAVPRST